MDPLSITAGAIAVLQLCASTGKLFSDLRAVCRELPGRLHALESAVADLAGVLQEVGAALEERDEVYMSKDDTSQLNRLLTYATGKLDELQRLLIHLTNVVRSSRVSLVQANSWRKTHPRLKNLQDDIQGIKSSLNILIGASNS